MNMITPKLLVAALSVAGFAINVSGATFVAHTTLDFQNDLTTAANNGSDNTIQLTNDVNAGYFTGTFNYNSTAGYNLTIEPGLTLTSANISIDGGAGGRDLNITSSGSAGTSTGNVTVSDLTFIRNTGSYQIGALRIAGSSGGTNTVSACNFLSPAADEGRGLEIASGLNTTIFGCSFIGKTNSASSVYDGDGLNIAGVTGMTVLSNNTFSGNYVGYGADITASSILQVYGNLFRTNYYGGLYFSPSSGSQIAQVFVVTNVFDNNRENGGAYIYNFNTLNLATNLFSGNPGGGAYVADGVIVTNLKNTYVGNTEGGLECESVTTAITSGNTFSGNSYGSYAGALFQSITTNLVTGNTFSGNIATDGGAGGADIYYCTYATLSNNIFTGNEALNGDGGGAYIVSSGNAFATVIGNTFTGNYCLGNYGGGALYVTGVTNTITQNTFSQNSSADGGGAINDTAPVIIITDNLLVNNSQSSAAATGGGIFVNASATLDMENNTIYGNTSGGGGGGASFQVSGLVEVLSVFNNIIWGNSTVGGSGGDVYITGTGSQKLFIYNDANDLSGAWDLSVPGAINQDPQFFDPINGDFHFPASSPCYAAGTLVSSTIPGLPAAALALLNTPPATDLDGNPRVNESGRAAVDMGCYEFNNTAEHPADTASPTDFTITAAEFISYTNAWYNGLPWSTPNGPPNPNPIPANYVTRAGYLLEVGGGSSGPYYNDGSQRPTNWKPGSPPGPEVIK
jgi:parallel beta-helix repeat protein